MHVGDVDAGHQLLQILNPVNALGFEGLAADHTHWRGHVLRAFFTASSGHGHGFQLTVIGFCRRSFGNGRGVHGGLVFIGQCHRARGAARQK